MLNINIPEHIAAAVSNDRARGTKGGFYRGFSPADRKKAGGELIDFLDKYRSALSLTEVSRRAGRSVMWAYNVEKAVRDRGCICPDAAQAFVDAAASFLADQFASKPTP